jgi:type IV pilus assembly protein PilW
MKRLKNMQSAGFTLIELMIAMTIAGIVSIAMYAMFEAQVRGQVSQDVSLEMTQGLRSAFELMETDIRMAGCDPTQGADAQILVANENEIRFTMDTGGGVNNEPNGSIEANEDIAYRVNTAGNLGREVGGVGGAQPLVLNCDVLNFVYMDEQGNILATPVAAQNQRDRIRVVQVSAVVRSGDTANPGFLRAYTDNTSYENLQGDQILAPPRDAFRRFQLSATIACRNQ